MSRFSALVNAKAEQATKDESQLSTETDSQHATTSSSELSKNAATQLAADVDIQRATEPTDHISTTTASPHAAPVDSQNPPPSQVSTETVDSVSRQSARRKVDSHRRRPSDSRKGDRHRGDKLPFNNRLSETTINRIKHFLVDHKLEQQEFAELAAIHFMDEVDSHKLDIPGSEQSHDDRGLMIMFKTIPTIINLYLKYNPENRWKPADDYLAVHYNSADIRLLEVGIITTQINANFKKVRSFNYYKTEIDLTIQGTPPGSDYIDIMLKSARRTWAIASGKGTSE